MQSDNTTVILDVLRDLANLANTTGNSDLSRDLLVLASIYDPTCPIQATARRTKLPLC